MRILIAVATTLLLSVVDGTENEEKSIVNILGTTEYRDLDPSVQHIPFDPTDSSLRPPPATVPSSFEIFIGSSVFRDGYRCGKTLFTALKRATHPERLRFGLLEQLVDGDPTCVDEYCKMAMTEWPSDGECRYKDQIQTTPRPAAEAAGCTTARHQQQKMIGDEEFCLQVDGHSIFTNGWDENLLAEWTRIDNEMAVLTVYPHDIHDFVKENGDNNAPDWLPHLCTTVRGGNGLTRIVGASIKNNARFPQMTALWGGGLSFSKCHAEKNVPVDSHTPWLWDGEEFLRSADYWTHGYDLYSPSKLGNVMYHNYSKKPTPSFWEADIDQAKKNLDTEMTHNRFKLRVGMPFKGPVDALEMDKYKFGTARSFQQYLQFANVSLDGWMNETNSCGQLHWVPYTNASEVEAIVGRGWHMRTSEGIAPTPRQHVPTPLVGEQDLGDADMRLERRVLTAHIENGAAIGDEKPEIAMLRQNSIRSKREDTTNIPAWGLLVVVLAALFVTLSNDSKSRAIRQSCVAKAPHLSHD